jgi:hypothetical protein
MLEVAPQYTPTRRFPRFPVELTVVCIVDQRRRADRVTNLSEEGARIVTPAPLGAGLHSHFYFIIPGEDSRGVLVDVSATVAWSRGAAMGLHFDRQFPVIAQYVSRLASRSSMR